MDLSIFLIAIYLVITFAISCFNAYSVGNMWFEARVIGGWTRILAYCGAIMSAAGFSYVYTIIIGLVLYSIGVLDSGHFGMLISLVYLFLVIPIIGSGLAITVNSVIVAYHQRSWVNSGIASWNIMAQAYNMYSAISAVPASVKSVGGLFKGSNNKDGLQAKIVIAIAIVAILGGSLTTIAIIRTVAKKHAQIAKQKYSVLKGGQASV